MARGGLGQGTGDRQTSWVASFGERQLGVIAGGSWHPLQGADKPGERFCPDAGSGIYKTWEISSPELGHRLRRAPRVVPGGVNVGWG